MKTRAAAAGAAALLALALASCTPTPAATTPDAAPSAPTGQQTPAATEMYGCTQGMLDYVAQHSYPDAVPLDPATLVIGDVSTVPAAECYLSSETDGLTRYGAIWTADPTTVIADLGAALTAAGYQQSPDYGPYMWWKNGTEPTGAEFAVGAAPQDIDGQQLVWATW